MYTFKNVAKSFTIIAGLGGVAGCSTVSDTYSGFLPPKPIMNTTNATETMGVTIKPPLTQMPAGVTVQDRYTPIQKASTPTAAVTPELNEYTKPAFSFQTPKDEAVVSQPIGHYEFCQSFQDACKTYDAPFALISWAAQVEQQITMTNVIVNAAIMPMIDVENPVNNGKEEKWTPLNLDGNPLLYGDCEDYALTKRNLLVKAGFPESAFFMVVLHKMDGEGHAVLGVNTDQGIKLLDNLTDEIKSPEQTSYTFMKRQSSANAGKWVNWDGPQGVGASRLAQSTIAPATP